MKLSEDLAEFNDSGYFGADLYGYAERAEKIERMNDELLTAIKETIEDNLELADGDDCTLIKLKRAIEKA